MSFYNPRTTTGGGGVLYSNKSRWTTLAKDDGLNAEIQRHLVVYKCSRSVGFG